MIKIFTDGACTGNGTPNQQAGVGVVIEWQGRKPMILSAGYGNKSNNEAEYGGLLEGLLLIKENEIKVSTIHSDSNLMVNQVNGNWKCKDKKLIPLLILVQRRLTWLRDKGYTIDLIYIPRELNIADNPAKLGKSLKEGQRVFS